MILLKPLGPLDSKIEIFDHLCQIVTENIYFVFIVSSLSMHPKKEYSKLMNGTRNICIFSILLMVKCPFSFHYTHIYKPTHRSLLPSVSLSLHHAAHAFRFGIFEYILFQRCVKFFIVHTFLLSLLLLSALSRVMSHFFCVIIIMRFSLAIVRSILCWLCNVI